MNFTVVVGDWSSDGHGKTETVTFNTNATEEELKAAYKAGVQIIGFDMVEELCSDYEDNKLPRRYAELLTRAGINYLDYVDTYGLDVNNPNAKLSMYLEQYIQLWCTFIRTGNPQIDLVPCS